MGRSSRKGAPHTSMDAVVGMAGARVAGACLQCSAFDQDSWRARRDVSSAPTVLPLRRAKSACRTEDITLLWPINRRRSIHHASTEGSTSAVSNPELKTQLRTGGREDSDQFQSSHGAKEDRHGLGGVNGHFTAIGVGLAREEEDVESRNELLTRAPKPVSGGPPVPVLSYVAASAQLARESQDGAGPRWFCPLNAQPPEGCEVSDLPRLLFLPGIDGTGLGLWYQHAQLARLFEVTCLHVPRGDRTPFQGLVEGVVSEVQRELQSNGSRPLFLVGESFGAILALSVAAAMPEAPLHVVLVNPATGFERTPLRPLLPLLESGVLPPQLYDLLPTALCFVLGDPVRMAAADLPQAPAPSLQSIFLGALERPQKLATNLLSMLQDLPAMVQMIPQDTLRWKLQLLKEGASATNGLLHRVKAPVLVLASGQDRMLRSKEEAERLKSRLQNCRIRHFSDSGHTLLLEENVDLSVLLKSTDMYARARGFSDPVTGFVPPSPEEIRKARGSAIGILQALASPVFFSTAADGSVHRGMDALDVPKDKSRPLLFVGNHQTFALDLTLVVNGILEESGLLVRGLAHPLALGQVSRTSSGEAPASASGNDLTTLLKTFGAVPVSGKNCYKLLANKEAVLLYPGGVREAYRHKGEEYQLFWPDRSEFVRMAAKHNAIIIPFAAAGIDDTVQILLDGPELLRLPIIGDRLRDSIKDLPQAREEGIAGPAEELFLAPLAAPRWPNRLYVKFQKPIDTEGMRTVITDKEAAKQLYLNVKGEVAAGLDYLLAKREEDPYKDFGKRVAYELSWNWKQAPTFKTE